MTFPIRTKPSTAKNGNSSSNKMIEYRSALSTFGDDTLTEIFDLMLNSNYNDDGKKKEDGKVRREEGDSTSTTSNSIYAETNHSKLVALYKKCKASAATIAKIEATPGFSQSIAQNANKNRLHKMNSMGMMNASKQAPPSHLPSPFLDPRSKSWTPNSNIGIGRQKIPQMRRSNSHGTSSSFSSQSVAGRKMKQHNTHNALNSNSGMSSGKGKDNLIPESALNFLAALNAKKPPSAHTPPKQQQPQQVQKNDSLKGETEKGRKNSLKRKRRDDDDDDDDGGGGSSDDNDDDFSIASDDERSSSSSNVTDNGDDAPFDEKSKVDTATRSASSTRTSNRSIAPKKSKKKKVSSGTSSNSSTEGNDNNNSSNDKEVDKKTKKLETNQSSRSNNKRPSRQAKEQGNLKRQINSTRSEDDDKSGKDKKRMHGNLDIVYDIGEGVAVYFEKDDQWYQATIQDVEFWTESTSDEKKEKPSESGRARRSSRRSTSNPERPATNAGFKVKFYTIEYDNGEIQENVPPEDVIDKLN